MERGLRSMPASNRPEAKTLEGHGVEDLLQGVGFALLGDDLQLAVVGLAGDGDVELLAVQFRVEVNVGLTFIFLTSSPAKALALAPLAGK